MKDGTGPKRAELGLEQPARRLALKTGLGLAASAALAPGALARHLNAHRADAHHPGSYHPGARHSFSRHAGVRPDPHFLSGATGPREVALFNLHTGERLRAEYWQNGLYMPDALRAISVILRDHYNNQIHPIEPRLLDVIHVLHGRVRSRSPFDVVCGYRSPETNAWMHEASAGVAAHSLHMEGRAIDIRLPGVRLAALERTALALAQGGVGYYPEDDFVHIDSGDIRHWRG
jgi:uncharacterized protein YcbK (DUF882 family)